MTTLGDIVSDATELIGQVAGTGVQTYGENAMLKSAIRSFNLLVKKYPWQQYSEWSQHTLDETLGIVDADAFSTVRDQEDFLGVFVGGTLTPIPVLPKTLNPFTITGTDVQYWTSLPATNANFAARRLQFWPKVASGTVDVFARVYPATMDADTTVYLNKDMLVYGTGFMELVGDDINPGAAETCRQLMDMTYKDVVKALATLPRHVSGNGAVPTQWYPVP